MSMTLSKKKISSFSFQNLSQQDLANSPDIEILDFTPILTSPFRLFGTNNNTVKKLSATDKVRRKRTPKTDDHIDGQKVKRRKSDMNMKQQESSSIERKAATDTNKVKTN